MSASQCDTVRGAQDVRYKPAGPGHVTTRQCRTCKLKKASGGGWRFDGVFWDCPTCAPAKPPATKRKPVAEAAAVVAAPDPEPVKRPWRIRSIDDLKAWCDVDAETGCWHYRRGAANGKPRLKTRVRIKYIDPRTEKPSMHLGRRAALNLARKNPVPESHLTWGKVNCPFDDCVNPRHSMSGPRKAQGRYLVENNMTDAMRGHAEHLLAYTASVRRVSPEQAVEIRRRLDAGETQKALALEFNVSETLIGSIKAGTRKCDYGVRAEDRKVASANASIFRRAAAIVESA